MSDINKIMASSIRSDMDALNVVSQNVSNVQTNGFKREELTFPSIISADNQDAQPADTAARQSRYSDKQGAIKSTDNNANLAILGAGFFHVRNRAGMDFLTRNGEFSIDSEGYLALQNGSRLEGEGGPVRISDKNFKVNERGEILQNDAVTDRIPVYRADRTQYVGNGLYDYSSSQLQPVTDCRLLQFVLEAANVNTTDEMLTILALTRHFNTTSKVLGAYDHMIGTSIDTLGSF